MPNSFKSAQKLTDKEIYGEAPWIFVGESLDPIRCFSTSKYSIQVNDVFIDYDQIPLFLHQSFHIHTRHKIVMLKIDRNVKMDVVYKIRDKIKEEGSYFHLICYVVR